MKSASLLNVPAREKTKMQHPKESSLSASYCEIEIGGEGGADVSLPSMPKQRSVFAMLRTSHGMSCCDPETSSLDLFR